jgi:hypothetical protein
VGEDVRAGRWRSRNTPTAHQEIDMFQQQQNPQRPQFTRGIALATTAVLTAVALVTAAGPAAARQDIGPAATHVGHVGGCFLARVGTQFVRCDDNTGNGVPAPAWVPER